MLVTVLTYMDQNQAIELYTKHKPIQHCCNKSDAMLNIKVPIHQAHHYTYIPKHHIVLTYENADLSKLNLPDSSKFENVSLGVLFNTMRTMYIHTYDFGVYSIDPNSDNFNTENVKENIKTLGQFNFIDPRFDIFYNSKSIMSLYNKYSLSHKLIDRISHDPNDTNCTLYLNRVSNVTIENTTLNNLILVNCNKIIVRSRVRNNIILENCESLRFERSYLNNVVKIFNVTLSRFNRIYKLKVNGGDGNACNTIKSIDTYVDYDLNDTNEVDIVKCLIMNIFYDNIHTHKMISKYNVQCLYVKLDDCRNHVTLNGITSLKKVYISNSDTIFNHIDDKYRYINIFNCAKLKEINIDIDEKKYCVRKNIQV